VTLVTFATERFRGNQQHLTNLALRAGWKSEEYSPERLEFISPDFQKLRTPSGTRGFGFWAWKPIIIRDALELLGPNDLLLYLDSGDIFLPNIVDIYSKQLHLNPYLFFEGAGTLQEYCKRDSLVYFNVDRRRYWREPMLEAGISFWKRDPKSLVLLSEWHSASNITFLIDDTVSQNPEHSIFIDHRHDQSLISIINASHKLPVIRKSERRSFQCNVGEN
jgi:hypothetical protein